LRAHLHPGRDLLGEDLLAADAVRGQRVQLRLQFLGEGGTTGVADPDVADAPSSLCGAGGGVPGRHGWPGFRSAGVITRNNFASRATLVKRPVW
jgi:hypothetical protein